MFDKITPTPKTAILRDEQKLRKLTSISASEVNNVISVYVFHIGEFNSKGSKSP